MTETADPAAATITAFLEQVIHGLDEGTIDVLRELASTPDNGEVDYSLTYHDHKIVVYENGTISVDGTDLFGEQWSSRLHDLLGKACERRAEILADAGYDRRSAEEKIREAAEQKARITELAGKLRL